MIAVQAPARAGQASARRMILQMGASRAGKGHEQDSLMTGYQQIYALERLIYIEV